MFSIIINWTLLREILRENDGLQGATEVTGKVVGGYDRVEHKCLDLPGGHHSEEDGDDKSLVAILDSYDQVFVTMPAKAAGTTLKAFTKKCTKKLMPDISELNKFFNNERFARDFLTHQYLMPPLLSGHFYDDAGMVRLIKHANRKSLIMYTHRNESDRLRSAIKQSLDRFCKGEFEGYGPIESDETHCRVDELPFVEMISKRFVEIKYGGPNILKCSTWDAIEENEPDLMFVSFKKADEIQMALANRFCPELLDAPTFRSNTDEMKRAMTITLANENKTVPVDDWLQTKKGILELSLNMNRGASCSAKTKHMEDQLSACPNQVFLWNHR